MKKKYSYRGVRVSSKVRVGAKGSKRQKSYCARSGAIGGLGRPIRRVLTGSSDDAGSAVMSPVR